MLGPTLALGAYLLGSVSFGLLAARRQGVDLREVGSGNIGATNVGRALGKRTGLVVLLLDAGKGAVPALVARVLLGPDAPWTAAIGVAAVIGHCYPVWHRFRGGKGAATAAGVMLALVPPAGAVAALVYVGLKKLTRRASVGSLGGALAGAATTWLLLGTTSPRTYAASAIVAVVFSRHISNIRRLVRGEEPPS